RWRGGHEEERRHRGDAGLEEPADAAAGLVEVGQRGRGVVVVGCGHDECFFLFRLWGCGEVYYCWITGRRLRSDSFHGFWCCQCRESSLFPSSGELHRRG